jgi:tetratricopeptide (TPR) repeat protein
MNLYQELRERRVFQFTISYIVGSFGLVEFLEFLEGRMQLSPNLVNLVGLALVLLLPSVIMLAWGLGRPGRDNLGRTGKVAVPANLLVAAVLLFVLFQDKELGAVTRTIEVEDENGAITERVVPKNEFRRRLVVFYPEYEGSAADDWAWKAAALLLVSDITQDIFVDVSLPFEMVDVMCDVGYEDGYGLPRALMRKVANDAHYDHFTTSTVRREGDVWHLVLALHESESGREVATHDYQGSDLFAMVDRATVQLRKDLGLPNGHIESSKDLPVAELTSSDLAAVKGTAEGIFAVTHHNDWEGAVPPLEDAVARDPEYALAHFILFSVYQTLGRGEESVAAMSAAMDNLYRVTERTRFLIKSQYYFNIEQDMDKATAVLQMWSRIYPSDVAAHAQLAILQFVRQDLRAAVTSYETILEIDPSQYRYLEDIADLYCQLGENDKAEASLQSYVDLFPSRADGYKDLADFYAETGRLDESREALEQAQLLEPGDITLALGLIDLDVKLGRYAESSTALTEALRRADTARDRARIHNRRADLALLTGRAANVAASLDSFYVNMAEVQNPLQLDIVYSLQLPALSMSGWPQQTIERLDELATRIPEPFDALTGVCRAWALTDLGRAQEARIELARATEVVDTYQFETFRATLSLVAGMVADIDGDLDTAAVMYRDALGKMVRSDPFYHVKLAGVLRRQGDLKEARKIVLEAMALHPAYPVAHLEMAMIRFEQGNMEDVDKHLETAQAAWVDADPAFQPALEAARFAKQLHQAP